MQTLIGSVQFMFVVREKNVNLHKQCWIDQISLNGVHVKGGNDGKRELTQKGQQSMHRI